MAKGSVRKKGKKWYYRFYVEDASGNLVQKEFTGTESKSETEKLLRQAMEDYEEKKFIAKAENTTLGDLLDVWAEEDLKTGSLSNGTVENYLQTIQRIKKHPISKRKLKTITSDHLQKFMDLRRRFYIKRLLQELYEILLGGTARSIPVRSISKAAHNIQSNGLCGDTQQRD